MITTLEIDNYIDNCFSNFKKKYGKHIKDNEDFDFLMFKYSPNFLYFKTIYGDIEVSKKIASQLMNMGELYKLRCERLKIESK
jgi:hypothetical protein